MSNPLIDNPNHYKLNNLNLECIDVIKSVLEDYEGFQAFCMGNVLKYLIRAKKKNGLEDLQKARKYLEWLVE